MPAYFLEFNDFFARAEVYSSGTDNSHRFVFLCRGALTLCEQLGWTPDVIHCHDWTTVLLPVMLNTTVRDTPLARCATVFTIHNLEHQGLSHESVLPFGRIPWSEFRGDSTESYGAVNMMKAGLYHSTKITTVSPTYAREILTPEFGEGLFQILGRQHREIADDEIELLIERAERPHRSLKEGRAGELDDLRLAPRERQPLCVCVDADDLDLRPAPQREIHGIAAGPAARVEQLPLLRHLDLFIDEPVESLPPFGDDIQVI